jgi:hypothetical protein
MALGRWRWIVVALAASTLIPFASAASATALHVTGDLHVLGAMEGALAMQDGHAFSWAATAKSVVVETERTNFTTPNPLRSPSNPTTIYGSPEKTTRSFGASTLDGTAAREMGALLVQGLGALQADATSTGSADLRAAHDPLLDASSRGGSTTLNEGAVYSPRAQLLGDFVRIETGPGETRFQGTLTLTIFEADYVLASAGRATLEQTGRVAEFEAAGVTSGHVTKQTLTLVEGTLRIAAAQGLTLVGAAPEIDFVGALTASDLHGDLLQIERDAQGAYHGAGHLALRGVGGDMTIAPAPSSATEGAALRAFPASWTWGGILGAAALLGGVAFLVLRRRAQADDEIGRALLLMDERLYGEAIAPLTRALVRRPHDALLQLDLAICLEETGQRDAARAAYEKAIHLAPANAEALYYYARLLARMAMMPESEAHLRDALLLDARLEEMAQREPAFRGNLGVSR